MKSKPRGAMVEISCEACGRQKTVRLADRKRGWGRFCSKACSGRKRNDSLMYSLIAAPVIA